MGANSSSLPGDCGGGNLEDLPELCIAIVLSFMEPLEIAKLARVNRTFRAAASADFIWVPKLPSNYDYVLDNLMDRGLAGKSKKDIYAALCRPRAFLGGTAEVWIDKRTGGVCVAISSKAMSITGIDDRRYWNHLPTDESRFQTVAYLHQIWWVELHGELEFQFPVGTYSLFFRLNLGKPCHRRMGRGAWNLDDVHGWDVKPVQFSLNTSKDGQNAASRFKLDNVGYWVNYYVGNFSVEDPNQPIRVKFSLSQIDCTHSKGGLCVDSVLIYPSSYGKTTRF